MSGPHRADLGNGGKLTQGIKTEAEAEGIGGKAESRQRKAAGDKCECLIGSNLPPSVLKRF